MDNFQRLFKVHEILYYYCIGEFLCYIIHHSISSHNDSLRRHSLNIILISDQSMSHASSYSGSKVTSSNINGVLMNYNNYK